MSGIAAAKAGMGYQAATERPRCANCLYSAQEYVDRMPPYDRSGLRCRRGGYLVTAYAVCSQYQAKSPTKKEAA
ncbi:hypothetical protein HNQ51_001727 [Inhella inkyongensis]|uniref:Uncharacterized protein n=1 Tax=Inhella inkyongensis TaxID=392593 RepID=A0A840S3W5_9BURK|nr:hypothetical protein [Inhella inkyongensis]MBB5204413.1 hypothetical protein [Inhella inkyongensis]